MKIHGLFWILCFGMVLAIAPLRAQEQIGKVSFHDFMIEPYVTLQEEGAGAQDNGFRLGNTYFSALWQRDEGISAKVKVGDRSLIAPPRLFTDTTNFGFFEAYVQARVPAGSVKMGLMPTGYGLEGSTPESLLKFPRSLWYQRQMVGLRDYGLSFRSHHNGHYAQLMAHNGEGSESNSDSRYWYTAKWGWSGRRAVDIGLSGTTGHYFTKTEAGDRLFRAGNIFITAPIWAAFVALEGHFGQVKFGEGSKEFIGGHFDIVKPITKSLDLSLRVDLLEPDTTLPGDLMREYTAGISVGDAHRSATLYAYFIKREEEGRQISNDEIRLSCRLTSSILD
jgi:hypothetical protein